MMSRSGGETPWRSAWIMMGFRWILTSCAAAGRGIMHRRRHSRQNYCRQASYRLPHIASSSGPLNSSPFRAKARRESALCMSERIGVARRGQTQSCLGPRAKARFSGSSGEAAILRLASSARVRRPPPPPYCLPPGTSEKFIRACRIISLTIYFLVLEFNLLPPAR